MDSPSDERQADTTAANDWQCRACHAANGPAVQACSQCGATRVVTGSELAVDVDDGPPTLITAASASSDSGRRATSSKSAALSFVLGFAFFNLVIGPIASSISGNPVLLIVICYGCIGAQFGLHAIWCVLAPVAWKARFTAAVCVAVALYGAFTIGFFLALVGNSWFSNGDFWLGAWTGILCIPMIALGIQTPLWLARIWHRWRIRCTADCVPETAGQAPGIRHILLATVVVALALAALRSVAALHDVSANDFVLPLLFGTFIAMMISLLTVLPITIATLGARNVAAALGWVLLLDGGMIVVLIVIAGTFGGGVDGEGIFYSCLIFAVFFVSLAGTLLIFRRLGYRLSWGRTSLSPPPAVG